MQAISIEVDTDERPEGFSMTTCFVETVFVVNSKSC